MITTAAEMLAFWTEQAQLFARHLDVADPTIRSLNANEASKAWTMAGLVRWRGGLGDPREDFLRAVSAANDVPAEQADDSGALTSSSFVAFLCDQPPPRLAPPARGAKTSADVLLDSRLDESIWTSTVAGDWDGPLERARANRRTTLVADTYANYRHILQIVLREVESDLDAAFRVGCELYLKRKRNGFYSGGVPTFGGGPDNAFVVDLRLAALAKWATQRRAAFDPASADPHLWRW